MGFDEHKKHLNQELEQFTSILNEILPRYLTLMNKKNANEKEEKELGEMENYLIEVNGKITEIKTMLDQDLFGETMNHYYKAKQEALEGGGDAQKRLESLRKVFIQSIQNEDYFNWN
ncbi:MAG: hypothetical protein QNK23_07435 [Crocinitomicaceae bacterium]|nr:hypothetical protein [Crocinitomicaceae bacterium]